MVREAAAGADRVGVLDRVIISATEKLPDAVGIVPDFEQRAFTRSDMAADNTDDFAVDVASIITV